MANGKEPDCVTCKHYFRKKLLDDPSPNIFKNIPRTIICKLHQVYLPYEQAETYLICTYWHHYSTGAKISLFEGLDLGLGLEFFLKKNNINIYTASQFYTGGYKKFCNISDLPKISEEDLKITESKK